MDILNNDTYKNGDTIQILLSKSEYSYIRDVLHSFYNGLKKLPKNMRTPKFYLLENMINTKFKYSINDN